MKQFVAATLLLLATTAAVVHAAEDPIQPDNRESAEPANPTRPNGFKRKVHTGAIIARHFITSHSSNLLIRPVRAVLNVIALTVNVTTGVVRDTALDTLFVPALGRRSLPSPTRHKGMDLEAWETDLDRITGTRSTRGSLDLLIDGQAFFDRLTANIAESRKSIKIRTYIFDNDDYALQIADMLKGRSADIPVDVLVDGIGMLSGSLVTSSSMPADFVTPVSIKTYMKRDSNVNLRVLANTWLMGDHTKTYIFDDEVAFLGGMNIGREYRFDWHDLMAELTGPVVDQLSYDADRSSAESTLGDMAVFKPIKRRNTEPSPEHGARLRLLYTRPYDAQIYRAQLNAIRRSHNYIYIQNAYFADDRILYELAKARRRGVDVRVIFPDRADSGLMTRSNVATINKLQRFGIKVFLYPGMSHVKAAIYDGWACFGTANFDKLSLKLNKEVNIGTSDPDIVAALKQRVFEADFAISKEATTLQPSYIRDHVYERIVDVIL